MTTATLGAHKAHSPAHCSLEGGPTLVTLTPPRRQILSLEAQKHCRKLDVVTVKGSEVPKGVFTYDTYLDQTLPSRSNFRTYSPDIWKKDNDLLCLRQHAPEEFRALFSVGLTNYLNGMWEQAAQTLRTCDAMLAGIGGACVVGADKAE
jgi:hypothetical protein